MIQITLPCCDAPVLIDEAATAVRCESCSIEHDLTADEPLDRVPSASAPALLAAA